MNFHPRTLLLSACFFLMWNSSPAVTIYVNQSAGGMNNGTTWTDAYTDLQLALAAATAGDEIWVAQGVYMPSVQVDVDGNGGNSPREVTFQIPSGVALYGGFAGGEMMLSERDWNLNPTILSGDVDNNDINVDGNNIAETPADLVGRNALHVIYTQSVSNATVLDGFIVTAGHAHNIPGGFNPNRDGGGWYNDDNPPADVSSPMIKNCRFSGNYAENNGGAIHIGSFTNGTYMTHISHCEFSGNEAFRRGGAIYLLGDEAVIDSCTFSDNHTTAISPDMSTLPASGGAVLMVGSNSTFTACQFTQNSATGNPTGAFEGGGGGAIYIGMSSSPTNEFGTSHPQFFNCGFIDNSVGGNGSAWGGAAVLFSDGGSLRATFAGCVFAGNTATDDGGAVANFARTITPPDILDPILEPNYTNCTFSNNSAGEEGGALYLDGYIYNMAEMLNAVTENCVLYGNTATNSDPEIFNTGENLVSYSLVAGSNGSGVTWNTDIGTDGGNNIDTDPLFVDAADPDGLDDVIATPDDGLRPTVAAIDAGNNAAAGLMGVMTDFVGEMRIQDAAVDMGAYESENLNPCGPLPAGLTNKDIGNTGGYPGTVCYDNGTYYFDNSGDDIWSTQDGFHYVYRRMVGNGEIIARVDHIGNNNFWDLAGVMMRRNLNPNSKNVMMAVNAGGLAFLQRRSITGWFTGIQFGGNGSTPKWIRLIRFGNFFAGLTSNNGINWQLIGVTYAQMPSVIFVGMATSTPLAGTPNTYEMSNLSIQGTTYKKAPFDTGLAKDFVEVEGPRQQEKPVFKKGFQVYPNPAQDQARIEFNAESNEVISLDLLDINGRKLRSIFSEKVTPGQYYAIELERNGLTAGVYFLRINREDESKTTPIVFR